LPAADRSKLRIDSALLAVAVRVEGRPQTLMSCTGFGYEPLWTRRCARSLVQRAVRVTPRPG
jgi:hypothetical protein